MDRAAAAELRSYIGFTDADAAVLRCLGPIALPQFGAIADEFYALIRTHECTFALLRDEAQAQALRASLIVWLGELLTGPHDDEYVARRGRIGRVHVRVGLEGRILVAAMGRLRWALQRIASDAFADDPQACRDAPLAIARVCDLDLAILLDSYREDFVCRIEQAHDKEAGSGGEPLDRQRRPSDPSWDATNVAVFVVDSNAGLVFANRKAADLTGYAVDELASGNAFALLFGEQAGAVRSQWLATLNGAPVEMEAGLRTRAGKTRTMRWHAASQPRSAGDGSSVVVVGIDMTREREIERRARRNERLAATGALAAGLAHEIRNPLNGASLHLSVLDRTLARSPEVALAAREATDVLRAEIKRVSALLTDFLEVARPRPLALVDGDANEIARSVCALLDPQAAAQHKELTVEPFALPATAKLDVERIEQAVANLVRNGLDAVGEGGRVVIRVRRLPSHVEIDVVDDGRGVPDPNAAIFDAFYTTKERGTGLGLTIVHRVVSDHGGDVRFDSRPGSTVFTIRIPAEPAGVVARPREA
jgi:PAS domain S-box-containing protein